MIGQNDNEYDRSVREVTLSRISGVGKTGIYRSLTGLTYYRSDNKVTHSAASAWAGDVQ